MGTLQVGGTTLGVKNTTTNKIDLSNADLLSSSSIPASIGGTWIKLEEKTASGQATLEMGSASLLSSTYDMYCIKVVNFSVDTPGSNPYGRFNINADGAASAAVYRYTASTFRSDVTSPVVLHNQGHSGTSFYMGYAIDTTANVSNDCHMNGFVYLPQPSSTSKLSSAFGTMQIVGDENHRVSHTNFVATYMNNNSVNQALTGFQFLLSGSGNISAGKFVLYGIKD